MPVSNSYQTEIKYNGLKLNTENWYIVKSVSNSRDNIVLIRVK